MKTSIGNNNKIKNTIIGNNNNTINKKEKKYLKIVIEITIGIIIALVSAYITYKLGWNK